jgi:CBS domain containing-hemolysin-like protein
MNTSPALEIESAAVLLALATVAAVQARAVRGAERHRIQELCRRRGDPARYEQIVSSSEAIAFVSASVVVVAAAAATLLVARGLFVPAAGRLAVQLPVAIACIAVQWCMLVVVPTLLTKLAGPWIVVTTWLLWRPLVMAFGPVVRFLAAGASLLGGAGRRTGGTAPDAERPADELRMVVDEAHREGRLEGTARDMIRGVIGLEEVRVSQIMTPRTQMIAIPLAADWDEAVRLAAASGHTRLPVWDRSSDDVVGIIHTRDMLDRLAAGLTDRAAAVRTGDIRPLLRPPWFVPEAMSVQTLLLEFQRGKTHMAIVTDEFGGVAGVVTIEDALEEIVGEIADEHDEAFSDGIRVVSPEVCEVLAHVPIGRLNARLHTSLPEEAGYETVGGYLFHRCGRIPEVGERITGDGVALEVLAATRRRIDLIRITRTGEPDGDRPGSTGTDGG